MRRFAFPLERVLDYRRLQAETERAKLQQLLTEHREIVRRRDGLNAEVVALQRFPAGTAPEFDARSNYFGFLSRQRRTVQEQVAQSDRNLVAQRMRTLEAERRRDLLERLRVTKKAAWSVELERELEQLAADSYRARLHGLRRSVEKRQIL